MCAVRQRVELRAPCSIVRLIRIPEERGDGGGEEEKVQLATIRFDRCDERLGTFVFSGIRKAPRGKVQIEVTFHIDSEGILGLTARDKATGQTVESQLKLGKGGRGSNKKRKKRPEAKPKPQQAAPAPLTMPTSGLAEQLAADRAVPLAKPAPKTEDKAAVKAELTPKKEEKKGFWAWLKGLLGLS